MDGSRRLLKLKNPREGGSRAAAKAGMETIVGDEGKDTAKIRNRKYL